MSLSLRSNPYVADLLSQPQALEDTLQGLAAMDFAPLARLAERLRSGALRPVVLTGMGSSYHALQPLYLSLLRQGIPALMIETSELIHQAPQLIQPEALLVTVSQSGRSVEVLGLLERLGKAAPLVGVTNSDDSPLAARAGALLLTRGGTEHSVSCKTYVTALAALAVLAEILRGQDPRPILSDLLALPPALADYLSALDGHLETLQHDLEGVKILFLTGRGASLAAAGTGGLIIKEAARFPAEGMSCAAFRHGPLELVSPETFVLVYEGLGPTQTFNRDLAADIQKAGGRSALVGATAGEAVFRTPPAPEAGLPVMEILPAQMLSLALARMRGHAPGIFARASKVTSVE